MKGILSVSKFSLGARESTGATGSDLILQELDTGNANNGTLVLYVDTVPSQSDMANIQVWTSNVSDFSAGSGTQITAVVSDGTRLVEIVSDTRDTELYAILAFEDTVSDITVSSNKISTINEAAIYVITCPNVGRYVKVQYDSDGTGGKCSQVFIGHNLAEARWRGARAAF